MPFKMKGTAMYDKVMKDGKPGMMLKKEFGGAMEMSHMKKSPMDKSPMDKSPMDKSPMDKSPMDKSPMDHAHGAMKLNEDSAMDMSHMKLTQDAAMKLTSALKKSPMDSQGLKNLAKANPDKLKYIGD
jgi:uncharacterized protein involved in copper resistance